MLTGPSAMTGSAVTGIASIVGLVVAVMGVIGVSIFIGSLVIIVVANRADPDPSGHRPQAVYFFAVSLVTLLISIFASAAVVSAILSIIGSHPSSTNNASARVIVLGGAITLIAVGLLVSHLRRGIELARVGSEATTPSRRVGQSYVAAATFIAILVFLVNVVIAVYLLFSIASPAVFGSLGGRGTAVRMLVDSLYLVGLSMAIVMTHRSLVPPGLTILTRRRASNVPDAPAMNADQSAA